MLLIHLEKLNGSGGKAANSCVRGSKTKAVLREGAGLCHCSLAERHITVPLPVPGDSGHCNEAQADLDPQHRKEQAGSAGSAGRIVSVCASVAHGSGLASLLLRGCE